MKTLAKSTLEKYDEIISWAPSQEPEDLLTWAVARLEDVGAPIGTSLTIRAAVKYKLRQAGYTLDQLETLLPSPKGLDPDLTEPLTEGQVAEFLVAVEALPDPTRIILRLLLETGIKIGEALMLTHVNISGEALTIGARTLPLSPELRVLLPTNEGKLFNITPHAIRAHTRKIGEQLGLTTFSSQTLRSTYAVRRLRSGVELADLQRELGHASTQATQRYLTLL